MQAQESVLLWFRRDLRLADNPALRAATATDLPVIPVFLWDPDDKTPPAPGAASRWWLHQSLLRLDESLRAGGSRLILRRGPAASSLAALAAETHARRIFANRIFDPGAQQAETRLAAQLRAAGLALEISHAGLLWPPGDVRSTTGRVFQVYTPFWRACWNRRSELPAPLSAPRMLPARRWPSSLPLAEFHLEPKIEWAAGLRAAWTPGEAAAFARLRSFARKALPNYATERGRPDHDGVSRLSPHLHFGEISPLQIWHAVAGQPGAEPFLRQLAWREFAHHLLVEHPHTLREPWNPRFLHFRWRRNRRWLAAWQRGRTGYPFVDAAMRQLWATGWMHNRARMVVASFLVKDLLIPWQDGAAWFLDTLVDADLANNTFGWQWAAGCGFDAAPYFRIFNPVAQGEKFDPRGDYIRRWLPELRTVSSRWIHRPWAAPPSALADAGVQLGRNYPLPIVDHAAVRAAALAAFAETKVVPLAR
ncbi:MAG: deoxyribodipyrimidine photo-lyase [Acidobacteriaceae bacterium]